MRLPHVLTTAALCLSVALTASAQSVPEVKLPPSPPGQAAIQVGGTWVKTENGGQRYDGGKWIVVDYSRPLLRGRKNIFGTGADYGKVVNDGAPVWRAGANATTTLTTQAPLMVAGKRLEPGVYNVFVDLKPGTWTLILSTQPRQPKYDPKDKVNLYGTYNYDPKFDVARVAMSVEERADAMRQEHPVEQFTIAFLTVSPQMLMLRMEWEKTVATAPIELAK
ncbi:DUF2911 domain-containing protein [Luteitalea sp.]